MSWILHLFLLVELQVVGGWVELLYELSALVHGIWKSFVVTTAQHVASWIFGTNLDHLEVVWEVTSVFYESVLDCIIGNVVYWDSLRILLEHVYLIWEFTSDHLLRWALGRRCKFCSHRLSPIGIGFLHLSNLVFHSLTGRDTWILPSFLLDFDSLLTIFHMLLNLVKAEWLFATRAHHTEKLHKIFQLSV